MSINLNDKVSLKIEGDIGQYQTIEFEKLKDIWLNFQALINSIAKNDIEVEGGINLSNFNIELCGFRGGSAIPEFCFTKKIIPTIADFNLQRNEINENLAELLQIANDGDYESLKERYPDYGRRNDVVNSLYNFRKSFGKSVITVGYYNGKFNGTYRLKEFKQTLKNTIIVNIETKHKPEKVEYPAIGKIMVSETGKSTKYKVEEILNFDKHNLTYCPEIIIHGNKQYILNFPLHSTLYFEDGSNSIKNEMLDIIAVEDTNEEAELSFNEQFDYLYNRLKDTPNEKLTKRMQNIKSRFNLIIKEVVDYGN